MDVHVVGKHVELSQEVRDAVHAKLERVTRYTPDARRIDVDFGEVDGRRADEHCTCEIIVAVNQHRLDAHADGPTPIIAFDAAFEKLEHQLHKLHDKRNAKPDARREGGPGRGGRDGGSPES